jgi:hypothetical protein
LELNNLYEYLYDLGKWLQTDQCLRVFEPGFRPWPHVFKSRGRSRVFYGKVDLDLAEDLQRLNKYKDREDEEKYTGLLRQVLTCFGMGIVESLECTMKNYLRQTGGNLANAKREPWERKAVNKMVCHNNHAERPFAVLKALAQLYPSLSLRNLSRLVHSLVNGTHRCADTFGKISATAGLCHRLPGIAITAHPEIKAAVNKLCSVRRKTPGVVTIIQCEAYRTDNMHKL